MNERCNRCLAVIPCGVGFVWREHGPVCLSCFKREVGWKPLKRQQIESEWGETQFERERESILVGDEQISTREYRGGVDSGN